MKYRNQLLGLILFICSAIAFAHFWRGATLSASEVGKRWGQTAIDSAKFKAGDEKIRASMAYSILKNPKLFKGKLVTDIRKELGDPDGFYFTDIFPAYMISRAKTDQEDSWQIVFLLNKDRKVDKVIVHKNCCDR
jgi:hypothetical protein